MAGKFVRVLVCIVTDSRGNYETGDDFLEAEAKRTSWVPPKRYDQVAIIVPVAEEAIAEIPIEDSGTNEITMR